MLEDTNSITAVAENPRAQPFREFSILKALVNLTGWTDGRFDPEGEGGDS